MRRFGLVLALSLFGGGGGIALADQPTAMHNSEQATAPSSADSEFVQKAAIGGLAEVKMAKLALDKAQAPSVKQFARRMLADHTKANTELKRIADKKNLTVPTQLDADHEKSFEKLASLSGADFDKEYMSMMVDDHKDVVSAFKKQADDGNDPELKSFAMKTLPTLQHHFDMAKADKKTADQEKTRM